MNHRNPFRDTHDEPTVELRCPACARGLCIAPLDGVVGLTACPHLDCQHVVLICRGAANGTLPIWRRDGHEALTLPRFLQGRARETVSMPDLMWLALFLTVFFLCPLVMCVEAVRRCAELSAMVALCTSPAFVLTAVMLIALGFDGLERRRDQRRLLAVRHRAFGRARWQIARRLPELAPEDRSGCGGPS